MRWLVLVAMMGCGGAGAQQGQRWEYAVLHVTPAGLIVEVADGPAIGERPLSGKALSEWAAVVEGIRVTSADGKAFDGNAAAMLTHAGKVGWEVVTLVGEDGPAFERTTRYLARRQLP